MYINRVNFNEKTLKYFDIVIDVRSPIEYETDSIPKSLNVPVLQDKEREELGKIYKSDAFLARKKGASIVIKNIYNFLKENNLKKNEKILIYCWRGGMRSLSLYLILKNIGYNVTILDKGYKEYRKYINCFFEKEILKYNFNILSGLTGTGKTFFLNKLSFNHNTLDLEKLANHKGSILGDIPNKTQPSQKKFESKIWFSLYDPKYKCDFWAESESNRIGKLFVPKNLFLKMIEGKVFNISVPKRNRVKFILKDYQYLINDNDSLFRSLKVLQRFLSNKSYKNLTELIKEKKYDNFVSELLDLHYDRVYSKINYYKKIFKDIKLNSVDHKSFEVFLKGL